jgi:hypothetical protein
MDIKKEIEKIIEDYCDGTYNGLEHANFIEYRSDGKTPQDMANELIKLFRTLVEPKQ